MSDPIQTLEKQLAAATDGPAKIDALNALAWELRHNHPDRATALSEEARQLSQNSQPPYLPGLADSLRNLARLAFNRGHYQECLNQAIEGLALAENLADLTRQPTLLHLVAIAYNGLGNYPEGLSYLLQSLKLCQDLGDRRGEADALNGIAITSNNLGNQAESLTTYEQVCQIYQELEDDYGLARTLNNMAMTHLGAGDYAQALSLAQESLTLSQRTNDKNIQMYVLDTLGAIYLAQTDYPQAIAHLQQSLYLAESLDDSGSKLAGLLNLARCQQGEGDIPTALQTVTDALALAEQIQNRRLQVQCHELLAGLYEQQGDLAEALAQYKQFHALQQEVFGEENNNRVQGLLIQHQTEIERQVAEIERQKNDELQTANAQLEERNSELAIINSVGEGLAKQLEFQAIIDLVGDKIRDIFQAHTVAIGFLDAEAKLINVPYLLNLGQRQSLEPLPFGKGLASHVIRSGEPLVINQDAKRRFTEYGTPYPEDEDGNSIKSWVGVPIMVGDKAIGGISLQDIKENAFNEADVRLLSTLAANMGVALENARLFDELQTRNREIAEALQQQTATSEILRAMAGSPSDVQPVFDAIAENAANLGGTAVSTVYRYDGQLLHAVAMHNLPPENVAAVRRAYPRPLTRDVGLSAMSIIDRTPYNVADVEQDPRVPEHMVKISLDAGMRSALFVPMIRQGVAIGAIGILRREAGAFTEKQIALLNTFADQAIIAIENVELFNETNRLLAETQQRNAELTVINTVQQGLVAQLDIQAILDLVSDQIRDIFKAHIVIIATLDHQTEQMFLTYLFEEGERHHRGPMPFSDIARHLSHTHQPLVINENFEEANKKFKLFRVADEMPKSAIFVPMLVGDEVRGGVCLQDLKYEHAFSESDVRLLTTITNSMSLAIENARLFDEIQQTNQNLSQTLEELKRTQGQLVEAEKMSALGGLVAGVAHEINTPVGVGVTAASTLQDKTTGFSEIYKSGQMKRSDLEKYLNMAEQSSAMILRNLERAAELIQSFKQVAVDQSSEERRSFLVKTYLEEILLSLRPKLKKTQHTIEVNGDDSLTLDSYPGAFSQIVTNLVMNSLLHAYGPDDQGQLTFDLGQRDGHLIFEYNDDGKGIPKENLSKIFEPFFTTKRTQGGSGLGLHIIYNLVTQRLGGAIHCESEVGSGTRFIIEVPVA